MHPRVERFPKPDPDHGRFLTVLRRDRPDRVPVVELALHADVTAALLDDPPRATSDARADSSHRVEQCVRLHHRLGYDVVKVSATIPFNIGRLVGTDPSALSSSRREWADPHSGPIQSSEDFERFQWPKPSDVDFGPLDAATDALPDGMALLGFSGGVLEFAMDLLGMQNFMLATRRDPELVAAVIQRVGQTIYGVFEAYCQIDAVCALWLGDDLGHKHGPLVSPKLVTEQIVPWYKRSADLAHRHGRPFILHSCGDTALLIESIIDAGIDAKHSFEDGITPVEQFADKWGDKVAVLGGVDVHILAAGNEDAIRTRTREILEKLAPRGGYAAGSGNSIPNYVAPEHYLAMLETVAEFNGLR